MIAISKPYIGEEEKAAVLEVLESGQLSQGPRTSLFEERFAKMCGVDHAVAVSSGTAALHLALLAYDIGPGDEVITTPFTFMATVNAILLTGAKPVLADIDEDTFNINLDLVEAAITPRTKAIMPVDLYGLMSDMTRAEEIAEKYGLKLIEDACQSFLATCRGPLSPAVSAQERSASTPQKPHDGRRRHDHDQRRSPCRTVSSAAFARHDTPLSSRILGLNYRGGNTGTCWAVQLDRIKGFVEQHNANFHPYLNASKSNPCTHRLSRPATNTSGTSTWCASTANALRRKSSKTAGPESAQASTCLYIASRRCAACDKLTFILPAFKARGEVLSLPIHPQLTPDELRTIAAVNRL